jgi:hypothetical protein
VRSNVSVGGLQSATKCQYIPLTSHIDSSGFRCDVHCLVETVRNHVRNAASEPDAGKARVDAPAQTPPTVPDYLTAEADRLESLKEALFAAFTAAPKLGIPTALVDLAAAYTSALRLQMSLRGLSAVPTKSAKAPMFSAARGR